MFKLIVTFSKQVTAVHLYSLQNQYYNKRFAVMKSTSVSNSKVLEQCWKIYHLILAYYRLAFC